MKANPLAIAASLLIFNVLLTSTAEAQRFSSGYQRPSTSPGQNVLNRPTVSPYLNLLQGGPGSYQSFVRPFAEQGQALRNQQRQIGSLQQGLNNVQQGLQAPTGAQGGLRPTGHTVFYRNYSHYYPRAQSR